MIYEIDVMVVWGYAKQMWMSVERASDATALLVKRLSHAATDSHVLNAYTYKTDPKRGVRRYLSCRAQGFPLNWYVGYE